MSMNKKSVVLVISIGLFTSSLFQECYLVNGKTSIGSFGLIAFLLGWMSWSATFIVWLSNPLYLLSCFYIFKNEKIALRLAVLAMLFSLSFTFIDYTYINEAGTKGKVDGYLMGYFLWLSSIILQFLNCSLSYLNKTTAKGR